MSVYCSLSEEGGGGGCGGSWLVKYCVVVVLVFSVYVHVCV